MTKQRDLVSCHGCQRLTREWRMVALSVDGVSREWPLCGACTVEVQDAVRDRLSEIRAAHTASTNYAAVKPRVARG